MATANKSIALRRLLAFGVDWFVIALWAGLLFAAVMIAFSGQPPRPSGPWQSQIIGFVTMTAPVILYFALSESSRAQATPGKRALGLRVVTKSGTRVPVGASILRSCIKFLPWEFGHIVANQAAFSATDLPGGIYLPSALSAILPTWWLASILIRGDAPYDVVASTRVIHRMPA